MYRAKLQELCQKRRWGLPRYSAMKDGPDHMPSFKASVYVNGATFTSPAPFTSSKEAHNQAAMLAFLSFSGSSTLTAECDSKEEVRAVKPEDSPIPAHSSVIIDDTDHLCKSQLQNYAQRNNLDPPIFTIKTEGLPHDTHFKATEQDAAKIALMSLSTDIFQKGNSGPFKNLLLELTQKEGFCKPTYKTTQYGSPHMPTFFSNVVVEGKEFHGKACKSKKQAEQDAAKIAYIALKECGLDMHADFYSSLGENKAVQSIHRSDMVESKHNLTLEDGVLLELESNEILPAHVKVNSEGYNPSLPISSLPISGANKAKAPKTSTNYLLCNRFKVYTSFPNDVVFPEGITVLPISDNKWVAVSLEFPNELRTIDS